MQLGILNDTCVEHARVYSRATVPMIGQAAARQGQSTQLTEHSPLGADQASNKERQQAVWDRTAVDRLSVTYRMRSIPPWFAVGYRTSREIPVYIHRTRGARFPLQERERRELPGWQGMQCDQGDGHGLRTDVSGMSRRHRKREDWRPNWSGHSTCKRVAAGQQVGATSGRRQEGRRAHDCTAGHRCRRSQYIALVPPSKSCGITRCSCQRQTRCPWQGKRAVCEGARARL